MNIQPSAISETTLAVTTNPRLGHTLAQVIRTYQANARIVRAHTKTRGEVSGGGKKPWRQKGTGRARAGSSRSPLWRGGGTTHGPRATRHYLLGLPQSIKTNALTTALAEKVSQGALVTIDELPTTGKTRDLLSLTALKTLLILEHKNQLISQAARNLPRLMVKLAADVNALDLLRAQQLAGTASAWTVLLGRVKTVTAPPITKKRSKLSRSDSRLTKRSTRSPKDTV
ncbi:50S ribosomal protein L4 [Candidatus Berkelbacteria bacterium]|nr:50S ribosomal protein L4 [Candidatus Berkelbacteria bacterium]